MSNGIPTIGVVGAGEWSRAMHCPALKSIQSAGRARYAGVCDLDDDKAAAYANELGARRFTDIDAMISAIHPDGLALLVGPNAMPAMIQFAAVAGIPFISEKPPATDSAVHSELIDAVGGLPHIVGYNRRHSPYVRHAAEWLDGTTLQAVICRFSRHRRRDPDFSSTAVHGIDTVRYLAGDDLADVTLSGTPANGVFNAFIGAWTHRGVRVELSITPDTGSAQEHYSILSADRNVEISFPQPPMVDMPGYVELHEGNTVTKRVTHRDIGVAADDLSALGGITGEHESFIGLLNGTEPAVSTLNTSFQTQRIREELMALSRRGEKCSIHLEF